jgi:O-antigen ligase
MDRPVDVSQRFVLFGLVCLIVFSPLPAASVQGWSVLVIQLAVLGLLTVFFLTAKKETADPQGPSPLRGARYVFIAFWGFVVWQCLPLPKFVVKTLSPGAHAFFQQFKPGFSSMSFSSFSLAPSITLKSGLALLPYFLIGFLIVKSIKSRASIVCLFSLIFFMGVLEASYGLFRLFRGSPVVSGTFVNRNHFAGYLEMVIPVGIGLILARKDRGKRALFQSVVLFAGVVVMALALLLSRSRSGVIILIFIFLFFLLLYNEKRQAQKRGVAILLISLFIVIVILSLYVGVDATFQRFSWDYLLKESRLGIWDRTWDVFTDFPLFGSGLGTFGALYPVREADGVLIQTSHAHNDYLEFLSELGIVGMGLLLGGVVFVLVFCFRKWHAREDALGRGLGFGGLASALSLLLHGLTDFNFQIPANILLFSAVLALTCAAVRLPSSAEERRK